MGLLSVIRRPIRLSVLLSGIPVLAIVPLVIFAAVLLHMTWSSHQREMQRDVEQVVQTLAGAVDAQLGTTVRRLERIADLPVLAVGRLDEFHWQMQQVLAASPDWLDLTLVDEDGLRLVAAAAPFDMLPVRPARPQRHPVFETGRSWVADLAESSQADTPAVTVSVPVRRDGRIRWVLAAHVNPKAFAGMLAREQARPTDFRAIFDRRLQVVAHSRQEAPSEGRPIPFADAIARDQAGTVRLAGAGVDSMFGWQRLASGWTVGVGMSTGAYVLSWRRSMLGLSLAGLLALGLALASSVALGRRIGAAVEAASADARLLVEQNAVPPVRPSGIRQFDALSRALHDTGERLSALLRSERQSRVSAEAANRGKDEFLAMLGHELRNPMSAINNAARLLRRDDLSGPQREQMSAVLERQNAHMKRLVDDLLDVGRVLSGKIAIARERVDLAEIAERAVTTMRVAGRLSGHQVRTSLASTAVIGDAVRLEQVITNLLGNAARYTPEGGLIELSVGRDGGDAVLRVRDDGIGMTPQVLARAFELFEQGDQALHREQGGLGIGLTLTRRLLEMHGGSIAAASDGPDRGSTFTVRLPLEVVARVSRATLQMQAV